MEWLGYGLVVLTLLANFGLIAWLLLRVTSAEDRLRRMDERLNQRQSGHPWVSHTSVNPDKRSDDRARVNELERKFDALLRDIRVAEIRRAEQYRYADLRAPDRSQPEAPRESETVHSLPPLTLPLERRVVDQFNAVVNVENGHEILKSKFPGQNFGIQNALERQRGTAEFAHFGTSENGDFWLLDDKSSDDISFLVVPRISSIFKAHSWTEVGVDELFETEMAARAQSYKVDSLTRPARLGKTQGEYWHVVEKGKIRLIPYA